MPLIMMHVGVIRRLFTLAVAVVLATSQSVAIAQASNSSPICVPKGYTVAFFNGVWNDEITALQGMMAVRSLIGDTYRSERVRFENFYNRTGSGVNATMFQDLSETFIQRAREIDSSGELEKRWELFWEASLAKDPTLLDRIKSAVVGAAAKIDGLYSDMSRKASSWFSRLVSNPPTSADLERHRARLDTLALEGQKVLMVAHSQGNLFMNQAYRYIFDRLGSGALKAIHIAPASSELNGPYVLADVDLVINGLRVQGLASVPSNSDDIAASLRDVSGHTLIGTYLDASRPLRAKIKGFVDAAMGSMQTPPVEASQGFFTATLTWNGTGDVDLHTYEPNGTHVFYQQLSGVAGALDVDNTVANGPEHYYASCDAAKLVVGTYRIGFNHYGRGAASTGTIQISSAQRGELITRSFTLGQERGQGGDSSPIEVVAVDVYKTQSGEWAVGINGDSRPPGQ